MCKIKELYKILDLRSWNEDGVCLGGQRPPKHTPNPHLCVTPKIIKPYGFIISDNLLNINFVRWL